MDISIMEGLGLTNAEAKTYVALLELGSSGASAILKRSGLHNSTLHRSLNSLVEKVLVSYIFECHRKVYQATDPNHFYEFMDDKRARFEKILPELKQKYAAIKAENETVLYRGRNGISEIYNRLLRSGGKEYLTFGGGKRVTFDSMGKEWWGRLHDKRIKLGISARQVFDESILEFGRALNRRSLSQVRFLSQEFEQLSETIIIGDCVAIVIFSENSYGILIHDKEVAESYRKNFEILWKKAKKY